jgi:exopolyphosphatase/guanosine-5'-triphosphate,3'-diphosphate pyrophosphatase
MSQIAAIDIGSNAIRLVIGDLDLHGEVHITKKFREPVRLGQDVFSTGILSKKTIALGVECFSHFRRIIEQNNVTHMRAIATSALREAKNRDEFIQAIKEQTGINIVCIDGVEEARLIGRAIDQKVKLRNRNAIIIDIGGGSVEVIISIDGQVRAMDSFKIGTVRLLQLMNERNLKEKNLQALLNEKMQDVRKFVLNTVKTDHIDLCIGTGGNFETLGKLRVALLNKTSIYSMSAHELEELQAHLIGMSVKERIQFLRIKADRADVIVPAALIGLTIMNYVGCELLSVPFVGLRDGVLLELSESLVPSAIRA